MLFKWSIGISLGLFGAPAVLAQSHVSEARAD